MMIERFAQMNKIFQNKLKFIYSIVFVMELIFFSVFPDWLLAAGPCACGCNKINCSCVLKTCGECGPNCPGGGICNWRAGGKCNQNPPACYGYACTCGGSECPPCPQRCILRTSNPCNGKITKSCSCGGDRCPQGGTCANKSFCKAGAPASYKPCGGAINCNCLGSKCTCLERCPVVPNPCSVQCNCNCISTNPRNCNTENCHDCSVRQCKINGCGAGNCEEVGCINYCGGCDQNSPCSYHNPPGNAPAPCDYLGCGGYNCECPGYCPSGPTPCGGEPGSFYCDK